MLLCPSADENRESNVLQVLLPIDDAGGGYLVADLGEITLKNRFQADQGKRTEFFDVEIKAMNLQDSGGSHLMEQVDIGLEGQRELNSITQIDAVSKMRADIKVSELKMACSIAQWELLFLIWKVNVAPSHDTALGNGEMSPAGDENEDEFQEASEVEPWLQQRDWLFSLHCSGIAGRLRGTSENDIAVVNVQQVKAQYKVTTGASEFSLLVSKIDLAHFAGASGQLSNILSSSSGSDKHLIAVKCITVSPDAAEHPGFDTWWDFDFRTLAVHWDDEAITVLVQYYTEIEKLRLAHHEVFVSEDARVEVSNSVERDMEIVDSGTAPIGKRAVKHVSASIEMLSATLMRAGLPVVRLAMTAARCKYEQGRNGSKTSGKLGDFVVEDMRRADLHFQEKLGLRDKSRSVMEFEFQTFDTMGADFPGHEYFLSLEMSSTRLVYVKDFIEDLRAYIEQEPLIRGIMGKTATAVAESAKKAAGHHIGKGLTKVSLKLVNPLVVLPVDEAGDEHLAADLGEITLTNSFEIRDGKREESFEIGIKAMNLQEGSGGYLMENVDIGLTGKRGIENGRFGNFVTELRVSDLNVAFSDRQCLFAERIFLAVSAPSAPVRSASVPSAHALTAPEAPSDGEGTVPEAGHRPVSSDDVNDRSVNGMSFVCTFQLHGAQVRALLSGQHGEADRDVAACCVSDVQAKFAQSRHGSEMTLNVRALEVIDSSNEADKHYKFLSSKPDAGGSEHLVAIKRIAVSTDAPDHPAYDTWWDFDFRILAINWNDTTVGLLVDYYRNVQQMRDGLDSRAGLVEHENEVECRRSAPGSGGAMQGTDSVAEMGQKALANRYVMHVTASIEMLSATLMRAGLPVVRLAMTAARCKYEQGRKGSKTSGMLGDFVVEDMRRADLHFPEKLGLRDKSRSVMEFEFQTFDTGGADFPGHEYFLSLEMSSTRLVYVKDFIEDLRRYMAEEPLMSGIMGKTATAVAESAKKAVGQRRQGKGLTKLELKLVNPLVVVPVDEAGDEHLVMDLGEIVLKNRFETAGNLREEHFDVEIKAMNLQEGGGSRLMENVDIGIKAVNRSALYTLQVSEEAPRRKVGFELEVSLSEVCANLSLDNFVLINSVSRCNFATPSTVVSHDTSPQKEHASPNGELPLSPTSESGSAVIMATMLLSMKVKKVQLSTLEMVGGEAKAHTFFALEYPSISYGVTGKGHTHLACSVMKLEIVHAKQAASPTAAVLRYYAEAKHVADGRSSMPQLHFEYTQHASSAMATLKIFLYRPEFVLHPSTVVAVYEYMMELFKLLGQDVRGRSLDKTVLSEPQTPFSPIAQSTGHPRQAAPAAAAGRCSRGGRNAKVGILVEVRKPRITVVEDSSSELDTKLVLQSTIAWQGDYHGGEMKFKCCRFSALEMFVSAQSDHENMRSVVDPFDMELIVQEVPERHGGIDPGECTSIVISSAVEAQLSYQDWVFAVLLVSSWKQAWLQQLKKDSAKRPGSSPSTPQGTPCAAPIKSAVSQRMVPQSTKTSNVAEQPKASATNSFIFRCTQIGITVINDCFSGSHMPVLEMRGSDMDGFFGPSNGALVFQTNVALEIDYFNMEIAEWEPFLEFWPLSISRWSTDPSNADWRIRAVRSGNINLSLGFLDCLSLNGKTLFRALETLEDGESVLKAVDGSVRAAAKINILHPYHVQNEIGVTIECSSINDQGEKLSILVEGGQCVPMDVRSSRRNQRKRLAKAQLITVRVGDSWEEMQIRIDRVGRQNLIFKPVNPAGTLCRVICNVKLVEGSKHVVLTSSVRVVNKTSHPFSLLFEPDGSQPQEGGMFDLEPQQTLSVPVPLVAHCCLRVQPTERHNWSAPLELRKPPRGADGQASPKTWLYNAGGGQQADSSSSFYVWVRMSSPDLFLITVTLTPVCTISNQLAVPVYLRLSYGEKEESASLPFGKSKSGPALARSISSKSGPPLAKKQTQTPLPTKVGAGMLLPVQEEVEDQTSLPAERDLGPDRVFGPYAPGENAEMYHFSPEEAVHLQVKMKGLKWSNFARIQVDRRFAGEHELHREVVCPDEFDHAGQQLLTVSVHNFVIRDKPADSGRDRRIALSCPYWIKNMTGLPLSFCLGSPFAGSADSEIAIATPRVLQNVQMPQMPEMMRQMPFPSSAALGLPGVSAPTMPSMPSMPSLPMMTARGTPSSYREGDTMMAGLKAFHDAEEATRSVSHGLVEQPLQLGGGKRQEQPAYPALMFSFTATKKKLLFVKVAGSQWSEGIPISEGGASGMVEIANQHGAGDAGASPSLDFLFQLSLTTSTHSGLLHRTEVLTLRPRFVIVNRLEQTVHYRQMGTMAESTLRPHHKTNFHWPDAGAPFELCFRLLASAATDGEGPSRTSDGPLQGGVAYEWSGGCDISMLGETHLRLRPLEASGLPLIMRVEVKNYQESLHVVLYPETDRTPPFRISNRSSSEVVVFQEGAKEDGGRVSQDQVAPNTSIPYAWDNPLLGHLLGVQMAGVPGPAGTMYVQLDAIGKTWSMRLPATEFGPSRNIVATVKADGPTKILSITDDVIMSLVGDVGLPEAVGAISFGLAAEELRGDGENSHRVGRAAARAFGSISLSVSLDRVCITLIDKQPQELLAATFNSVSVVYMRGIHAQSTNEKEAQGRFRSLDAAVKTFQLDNMLARTPYPVALFSSKVVDEKDALDRFLAVSLLEDLNDTVTNVPILKRASAEVQDLELNIEGRLVLLVYLYYVAFNNSLETLRGHSMNQQGSIVDEERLFEASHARRIYFERFSLPAVNLNFSYARRDLSEEDTNPSERKTAVEVAQVVLDPCFLPPTNQCKRILALCSLAKMRMCMRTRCSGSLTHATGLRGMCIHTAVR
jgi:hypothetical protein